MAEEKKDGAPKKAVNMALIFQLVFTVLNIGGVGAGLYFVYASTLGYHSPEITEEVAMDEKEKQQEATEQQPLVFTMEKFTANLSGEPKRMVRLEVNLEMLDKNGFEEVIDDGRQAKVRDKIMRILNDKSLADIESFQGKLFLKDKIASAVNDLLDKGVVKEVYFTDFVVQ